MRKVTFAVILLGIVCRAFDLKDVRDVGEDNVEVDLAGSLDQSENLDQPEFPNLENFAYLGDIGGEFEDESLDEIKAIQDHVKYQDAARDALLEVSSDLRKSKNVTNNVTNAFLKVIDKFEKEIAEFHAALRRRRVKNATLTKIKDFIKEAAKDRMDNTKIIRALTSQGLFLAERLAEDNVRKRTVVDMRQAGARVFLQNIESRIGTEAFQDSLSITGLVTLIFVIDDTGSMTEEIGAAQFISEQIIKARRKDKDAVDVDFILSTFNDPDTGRPIKKNKTESAEFLTALKALRAHGGGDCKELGFTGMINALFKGPRHGSSMYVFTDAPPKDATESNKELLLTIAQDLEIKVNFFIRTSCDALTDYQPYYEVARETYGLAFRLNTTSELKELGTKLVDNSIEGTISISDWGWASSRRRRSTDAKYSILIDDSIEKVTIVVTAQNHSTGISLIDPIGKVVSTGIVSLTEAVVYNIDSPITGIYKLVVPANAGEHKYKVNGVSGVNIDFGHYFVAIARRGTRIPVPLDQPLQGFPAKAFITIAGAESVNPGSLRIKVVDEKGTANADKPLIAVGTSGVRYFVRFDPPSGPFKLQLHGQTVKGSAFVRESSSQDQTAPVLLKLSYKEDSNILPRNQTTKLIVQILRGDISPISQSYTLSLADEHGYGSVYILPRPVYRGRRGFAGIKFDVPADAPVGKTENVKLSLTRNGETRPVASLMFSLLLV